MHAEYRRAQAATALGLALLAATWLGGCAVGPDFRVPDAPAVSGYTNGSLSRATVATDTTGLPGVDGRTQHFVEGADVPAQWWTLFHSAALDRAIRAALDNSPTVAEAEARVREARQNLAATTGATRWPSVDASLDTTRQQINLQSLGIPNIPSPGPFTLYGASVQVSYMLDLFGGQRRELESLRAAVDFQRFEQEAARLTLAANVATAAIREASLRTQIDDTTALAQAQREQLRIIEGQFRLGGVAAVDVRRQRGDLAQTEATLPDLARQLDVTRHQLAVYLGQPPESAGNAALVPEFRAGDLQLPADVPVILPATLAQRRPDIRAAQALLHQASAGIGVATANLYPQLTLSGKAGFESVSARRVFDSLNVWSLAAGLVQPVFHGGQLLAQKRAAEAAYDQSLAAYRQAVLTGLREVADALRAVETGAQTMQARATAAREARDTLATVSAQYRLGGVSQLTVLDAQRQYRQASVDLTQAQAGRFADTAALLQALGGGWWQHGDDLVSGVRPETPR